MDTQDEVTSHASPQTSHPTSDDCYLGVGAAMPDDAATQWIQTQAYSQDCTRYK